MVRVVSKVPTVRLRKDFRRIFAEGRRFDGRRLTAIVVPAREPGLTRMAFVVGKKLGNAVTRNRLRRRMREAARRLARHWQQNHDVVLIAKPTARQADYHSLCDELTLLLRGAGILGSDDKKAPCSHE